MSEFATLLKAARNLDQKALTTIFDLFSPGLYRFVSWFAPDPAFADRIVTEEFIQLVEDFAAGQGPRGHLRCHLYRSAYHRMVGRLRQMNPSAPLRLIIPALQKEKSTIDTSDRDGKAETGTLLDAMNAALSDDQRLVLILRFVEEFSVKETADILGKEVSNVKVIQSRGVGRLRKAMGMEAGEMPANLLRSSSSEKR